jgi:hypothetical protein
VIGLLEQVHYIVATQLIDAKQVPVLQRHRNLANCSDHTKFTVKKSERAKIPSKAISRSRPHHVAHAR